MRTKRIIISFLLVLFTFVSGGQSAYANQMSDKTDNQKYYIEDGYIVDNEGHQYYNFVNGAGEEISLEEALIILNEGTITESMDEASALSNSISIDPQVVVPILPVVTVSSINKNYVGAAQKVTPDFQGPCTMQYTTSTSVEYTISQQFGVSIENDI